MAVEIGRRPVEALARAASDIAAAPDLRVALEAIATHAAEALRADLAVIRVADRRGVLAALAVGGDPGRAARHALEVAVDTTQARAGTLWRIDADGAPRLAAGTGAEAAALAAERPMPGGSVDVERRPGLPAGTDVAVTLR